MYQCPVCKKYYTLTEECNNRFNKLNENNPIVEFIVQCECGHKYGVGGEGIYTPFDEDICVYIFGFDPTQSKEDYEVYPALMLKETDNTDTKFSTVDDNGNVIHLIPDE